jgi:hypothetical protein
MTDFGAIDQGTTMGTATGDLSGAVSRTLLGSPQGVGNAVVFRIQHHWGTESSDTLLSAQRPPQQFHGLTSLLFAVS